MLGNFLFTYFVWYREYVLVVEFMSIMYFICAHIRNVKKTLFKRYAF